MLRARAACCRRSGSRECWRRSTARPSLTPIARRRSPRRYRRVGADVVATDHTAPPDRGPRGARTSIPSMPLPEIRLQSPSQIAARASGRSGRRSWRRRRTAGAGRDRDPVERVPVIAAVPAQPGADLVAGASSSGVGLSWLSSSKLDAVAVVGGDHAVADRVAGAAGRSIPLPALPWSEPGEVDPDHEPLDSRLSSFRTRIPSLAGRRKMREVMDEAAIGARAERSARRPDAVAGVDLDRRERADRHGAPLRPSISRGLD